MTNQPNQDLIRALAIVRDHGPILPESFAPLFWPDDSRWSMDPDPVRGLYLGDGNYLFFRWIRGWLKRELVRDENGNLYNAGYILSDKALKALAKAEPETEQAK